MAIKTYRPTTQTLRYRTSVSTTTSPPSKPHKPLVEARSVPADDAIGRHDHALHGGGHKRQLRTIDFKRDKMVFPQRWRPSNTIPDVRLASRC